MKIVVTLEIPDSILAEELQKDGMSREEFIRLAKVEFEKEVLESAGAIPGSTATCVIDP